MKILSILSIALISFQTIGAQDTLIQTELKVYSNARVAQGLNLLFHSALCGIPLSP